MTRSNDAKTPSPVHKTQAQTMCPPLPNDRSSQSRKHPPVTTLLIALIAISGAVYSIYTNQQLNQKTTAEIKTLLIQVDSLKADQLDAKKRLETTELLAKQSETSLKNELDALKQQVQVTLKQSLYLSKDWVLLKARYCLELAQINAHWSDNSATTIALLQQANRLLASLQDESSFSVRQAITKEIAQLQSIPSIDIAGLLSQIDAIENLIIKLPLKPVVVSLGPNTTPTNESNPSAWRKYLKESLGLLQTLVVIHRHDETIHPLPSPAYESMLHNSILLNLQQAQWAILQHHEAVYQRALTQALQEINQTFEPNTSTMNLVTRQLKTLQQTHLIQPKPLLDESLSLLNQLIETKSTEQSTPTGENS